MLLKYMKFVWHISVSVSISASVSQKTALLFFCIYLTYNYHFLPDFQKTVWQFSQRLIVKFSSIVLSVPLIKEWQLSVERMCMC